MAEDSSALDLPSSDAIHVAVQEHFGFFPCKWQVEAALIQLQQKDLVLLASMGSGKTLTFWILLLFNGDGITIMVTPLVILGDKNVAELSDVSIPALNLTTELVTDATFKVVLYYIKPLLVMDTYVSPAFGLAGVSACPSGYPSEIESLKYCVIITSPECVLKDHRFLDLWKSKKFVNKLFSFIFDEAHCIVQWSGDFCPKYADLRRLHWLLPSVLFYAVSVTLPSHTLKWMQTALHMRQNNTREIRLSNDQPNINLLMLPMQEGPCELTANVQPSISSLMALMGQLIRHWLGVFAQVGDNSEALCLEFALELLEFSPELLEFAPELVEFAPKLLEFAQELLKFPLELQEFTLELLEFALELLKFAGVTGVCSRVTEVCWSYWSLLQSYGSFLWSYRSLLWSYWSLLWSYWSLLSKLLESQELLEFPPELLEFAQELQEFPLELQEFPLELQEFPLELQEFPLELQEFPPELQEFPPELQEFTLELLEFPPKLLDFAPKLLEFALELLEFAQELLEFPPELLEFALESY
ncbi:P-loop containing nucleoside triphosphate hydrolase protein [Lactarius quietus]|nr:P-loop containing nucleoside triphosphate hydrolase protein [Lactarius quietus]